MGSLATGGIVESAATASFGVAPTDWSIWNQSWARTATKSGGGATITNPILVGGGLSDSFTGGNVMQWTNGSISATGSVNGGIYVDGTPAGSFSAGVGYSLTFPADTTPRNAILYFTCFSVALWVTATLSDGSATPLTLTSTTVAAGNSKGFRCDFTYAANSPGQTLLVSVTMRTTTDPNGNVALQAAAYSTGVAPVTGFSCFKNLLGVGG